MKKIFFLWMACVMVATFSVVAQSSTSMRKNKKALEKERLAQTIKTALDKQDFTIEVEWAYPITGQSISLTSNYSLSVRGNKVNSYLPYYGRAYSIPYGGGKALNFEGEIKNFVIRYLNADHASIYFEVNNDEDFYKYNLDVFLNGNASVNVTSNKRTIISFQGKFLDEVKLPK